MAVEQYEEFLNLTDEDASDAYDAWAILGARLDDFPNGARQYFKRLCEKIEEFDPHTDDELALTEHLEMPIIMPKNRKVLGGKSPHDHAHVFDWVVAWQKTEGVSLDQAFWDYVEIHGLDLDQRETIKGIYHKVRRARLKSMGQERPNFRKPLGPSEV
ncbi:hypothetical protein [Rhodovulum sulfidophilum]|uniref:hypothetical protein n=1 Tax=Rhodovulum sulfidophilum TaxID=35806 RepID=UPI000952678B|nr:hypothetical protein [Rhodovulum sulfidophilum]MBL3553504.1 hypothetical protein [Rhodovulum sulfidophilum]OLS49534.1 hypothetical protein BV379_15440 [Rhodovulum sulfidophilum]